MIVRLAVRAAAAVAAVVTVVLWWLWQWLWWLWWLQWMYRLGCCPSSPQPSVWKLTSTSLPDCLKQVTVLCCLLMFSGSGDGHQLPSVSDTCSMTQLHLRHQHAQSKGEVSPYSHQNLHYSHFKDWEGYSFIHPLIQLLIYLFIPASFFVPRNWKADKCKHGWMNILVLWKGRKLK